MHCKMNPADLQFKEGEIIAVELDPKTGRVTYSQVDSLPFTQETSIRPTTKQPIHFCVVLYSTSEARLLR